MVIEVTGLLGLIILILDIWAIVKTVESGSTTGSKVLWIFLILMMPVVGFLIWLIFGPKNSS